MSGFSPPPYPYTRLARLAELAIQHDGGMVDLSVGTPCDPAPDSVIEALGRSGSEHGYPSSVGSGSIRGAATRWIDRRFGVTIDESASCDVRRDEGVRGKYSSLPEVRATPLVTPCSGLPSHIRPTR